MIEIKKILVIVAMALLLVIASSAVAMAKQEKITDTFKLKQGYSLHLAAIDVDATKAWIELTRANGDVVSEHIIGSGDYFSMYDGDTLIVEVANLIVFQGTESNNVRAFHLIQYNKNTGNPILTIDTVVLFDSSF